MPKCQKMTSSRSAEDFPPLVNCLRKLEPSGASASGEPFKKPNNHDFAGILFQQKILDCPSPPLGFSIRPISWPLTQLITNGPQISVRPKVPKMATLARACLFTF